MIPSEDYIPGFTIYTAQDSESDPHAANESIARPCGVVASYGDADTQQGQCAGRLRSTGNKEYYGSDEWTVVDQMA